MLVHTSCKLSRQELQKLNKKATELGVSKNRLIRIAVSHVDNIKDYEEQLTAITDRELVAA